MNHVISHYIRAQKLAFVLQQLGQMEQDGGAVLQKRALILAFNHELNSESTKKEFLEAFGIIEGKKSTGSLRAHSQVFVQRLHQHTSMYQNIGKLREKSDSIVK